MNSEIQLFFDADRDGYGIIMGCFWDDYGMSMGCLFACLLFRVVCLFVLFVLCVLVVSY